MRWEEPGRHCGIGEGDGWLGDGFGCGTCMYDPLTEEEGGGAKDDHRHELGRVLALFFWGGGGVGVCMCEDA